MLKRFDQPSKRHKFATKLLWKIGFFTSANSTQTSIYKIIAQMLYIYNISIVSIDLRYFLCGITKS